MCLAVPGKVVEFVDAQPPFVSALVEFGAVRRLVSLACVPEAGVGDYVMVHAGLRPGVSLDEQKSSDLRWIRAPFLDHGGRFERFVIHGHTVTAEPDVRGNRIGIDTGAYRTGRLTALALEGDSRRFLTTDCPEGSGAIVD